jgi:diaminopimelate epimerase
MNLAFTKMHGLGNDFIVIDCRNNALGVRSEELSELSRRLCHRRLGIGADQMILLYDSTVADFRMRILNADGSEVEMCGNGIRCFAKYIWDRGLSAKDSLDVETLAGIMKPEKSGAMVRVDMGAPVFEPEKIPVKITTAMGDWQGALQPTPAPLRGGDEFGGSRFTTHDSRIIDLPLKILDREFKITCVSMGNPHAVIVVENVDDLDVGRYGPLIENHALFPKRTNVEFIQVIDRGRIRMRVWERGSGETMACGTGASAAAVAANMKGLTDRRVTVVLTGGELVIEWKDDDRVYMTGPAAEVFEGRIDI